MGFRLKVTGGAEQIALDEKSIKNVVFGSESAVDSNARATDFGCYYEVLGKIALIAGGSRKRRYPWTFQVVSSSLRKGRLLSKRGC